MKTKTAALTRILATVSSGRKKGRRRRMGIPKCLQQRGRATQIVLPRQQRHREVRGASPIPHRVPVKRGHSPTDGDGHGAPQAIRRTQGGVGFQEEVPGNDDRQSDVQSLGNAAHVGDLHGELPALLTAATAQTRVCMAWHHAATAAPTSASFSIPNAGALTCSRAARAEAAPAWLSPAQPPPAAVGLPLATPSTSSCPISASRRSQSRSAPHRGSRCRSCSPCGSNQPALNLCIPVHGGTVFSPPTRSSSADTRARATLTRCRPTPRRAVAPHGCTHSTPTTSARDRRPSDPPAQTTGTSGPPLPASGNLSAR